MVLFSDVTYVSSFISPVLLISKKEIDFFHNISSSVAEIILILYSAPNLRVHLSLLIKLGFCFMSASFLSEPQRIEMDYFIIYPDSLAWSSLFLAFQ